MGTPLSRTAITCALFASPVQETDQASSDQLATAIASTIRRLGVNGCYGRMAQEFGDHPEVAAERMIWARHLTDPGGLLYAAPRLCLKKHPSRLGLHLLLRARRAHPAHATRPAGGLECLY